MPSDFFKKREENAHPPRLGHKNLLILNTRRGSRQGYLDYFSVRFLGLRSGGSPGGICGCPGEHFGEVRGPRSASSH